jgi:hypothetical protein
VTVTVYSLPIPEITGNTTVRENSTVEYSANIPTGTSNTWSVQQGGSIEGDRYAETVKIHWASAGTGNIRLVQENEYGCTDTATKIITIDQPPKDAVIRVGDHNFGSYPITSTARNIQSVIVTNLTKRPVEITSIISSDPAFIPESGYLNPIPYNDESNNSILLGVEFRPVGVGPVSGTLAVLAEGKTATAYLTGNGIAMPPDAAIPEMELSIVPDHAEVGEIVNLILKIKSPEELSDGILEFETIIGINPYVLCHLPGLHNVDPPQTNVYYDNLYADRPMHIRGRRRISNEILASIEMEVLLGTSDRTEIAFKKSPVWNDDPSLPIYTNLVDSLFIVDLCEADGKRLLKHKTPETRLLAVYPNPSSQNVSLEYYLSEDKVVEIYLANTYGEEIKHIINSKPGKGRQQHYFNTEGLHSGLYFLIIKCAGEITTFPVMIVK